MRKAQFGLKLLSSGKDKVISELALFESASTLARLYHVGTYTRPEASKLYSDIYKDRLNYKVVPLGSRQQLSRVASTAFNLPAGLRLRTLDAIHLAVAKITQAELSASTPPQPLIFISADAQLLRVAQTLGFAIENPEDYP